MKSKAKNVFWFIFFLLFGLASLYFTYYKFSLYTLLKTISSARLLWYIPVLLATIICHLLRAARWQLLIKASNTSIKFSSSLLAILIGYFINFMTPRFGEIARCIVVRSTDNVPLEKALGTVFMERFVDVLSLFSLFCIVCIFYFDTLRLLIIQKIWEPVKNYLYSTNNTFWLFALCGFFIVVLITAVLLWIKYKDGVKSRFAQVIENFISGFISIVHLKQKGLFFIYTVLIWVMYILMTYFWFFSLPETAHLNVSAALFVVSIAGIARALPVQAYGMGLYQNAVMHVLVFLGVPTGIGLSLGTIIYSGQTLFYLISGGACFMYYLLIMKKNFKRLQSAQ